MQVPRLGERIGLWGRLGVPPGISTGRGLAGDDVHQAVRGNLLSASGRWPCPVSVFRVFSWGGFRQVETIGF